MTWLTKDSFRILYSPLVFNVDCNLPCRFFPSSFPLSSLSFDFEKGFSDATQGVKMTSWSLSSETLRWRRLQCNFSPNVGFLYAFDFSTVSIFSLCVIVMLRYRYVMVNSFFFQFETSSFGDLNNDELLEKIDYFGFYHTFVVFFCDFMLWNNIVWVFRMCSFNCMTLLLIWLALRLLIFLKE